MNIYISQCSVCYIYITGNVLLFVWPRYMYLIPEISVKGQEPNKNHGVSAIPDNPANPQSETIIITEKDSGVKRSRMLC